MREFEPSAGFVSRVMKAVTDYEEKCAQSPAILGIPGEACLPESVRYVISSLGVFFGVLLVPATCL